MPSDERWKGMIETKVTAIETDVKEIKDSVHELVINQATKDGEARAMRRMAIYVSGITTAGIEVARGFVEAWWTSRV